LQLKPTVTANLWKMFHRCTEVLSSRRNKYNVHRCRLTH